MHILVYLDTLHIVCRQTRFIETNGNLNQLAFEHTMHAAYEGSFQSFTH